MHSSEEESHEARSSIRNEPKDWLNLAYIFLLFHGIGFLLPWNVFINAKEYFMDYKLNTTISYDVDYRINFMSYIGFAAQFPGVCFAAWNTFYHNGSQTSNPVVRFVVAMIVEIIILLLTIILAILDTSHMPGTFFALTIASVVLINCCVGIHQTLTFGMAAILPMKYSNAVIIGSNICGTIISTINILTKSLAAGEVRTDKSIVIAAVAYFLVATTIVVGCLITYFWLRQLEFIRFYAEVGKHLCVRVSCSTMSTENSIVKLPRGDDDHIAQSSNNQSSSLAQIDTDQSEIAVPLISPNGDGGVTSERIEHAHVFGNVRQCFGLCCIKPPRGKELCSVYWSRYLLCLAECWPQCLNVWAVFFCSLSIFPSIQSMVKPVDVNYFISPLWFTDITCFLFFNLFAVFGCLTSNWVQFPGPRYLWIPVWLRMALFIPFFLFSNFGLREPNLPVLVGNDHVYVLGCVLFAFTNGYLSSLAIMYAPRNSPRERTELVGMLAAFFLMFGVCSGVYASRAFAGLIL